MAGVEYVPEATCPKWEAQIRWAFIGDENLIEGFQMLCGYALLGTNPEHKFVILWGGGRNGKTTIQNVLGGVLGEYAAQAAPETFMARKNNDGPRSDLARIVGARLVTTAEPEKGKRLAINFIKRLTGGDALQFREMYEKEKEVKDPGILVMMATNPKPVIPEQTDAAWRRPLLWPFNAKVLDDQVIVHLDKKLLQEGPGILNWLLEGLKKYYQNGYRLKIPEAVKLATDEYKEEMDLLAPWRHECTMNNPEVETSSSVLFESHRQWETQPENMDDLNHPKVMSRQRFGRLMSERYSSKKDTNGNMVYLGIGLKGQGRLT
jgi:putative DNA primase/helicase